MHVDVFFDRLNQIIAVTIPPSPQRLPAKVAEEAFAHVQPRRTGRREVKTKTRIAFDSCLHLRMFVRRVVVADQMNLLVRRATLGYVTHAYDPNELDEDRRDYDSIDGFPWTVENK